MARSLRRVKLLNAVLLDREAALAEYRQQVAGAGTPPRLRLASAAALSSERA
jgi:hypothetical protein